MRNRYGNKYKSENADKVKLVAVKQENEIKFTLEVQDGTMGQKDTFQTGLEKEKENG